MQRLKNEKITQMRTQIQDANEEKADHKLQLRWRIFRTKYNTTTAITSDFAQEPPKQYKCSHLESRNRKFSASQLLQNDKICRRNDIAYIKTQMFWRSNFVKI